MSHNGNGKPSLQSFHPKHRFPLYNTVLPLDIINVLAQPRKTFEEIELLGDDVGGKNLYELLLVARFTEKRCKEYIKEVNDLWETHYKIDNLASRLENGEKIFYVLIDGERRFRGCLYLRDVGCESCRAEFGEGGCYERHFGDLNVEVRIIKDPSPDELIDRQASANIHRRVPPYEESRFYNKLFQRRKKKDPSYTRARHAKRMGRSTELMNQHIGFWEELPVNIRENYKDGKNSWGIAMELLRLSRAGLSEEELQYWFVLSVTGKHKVEDFRKLINEFLNTKNSGQSSLFDIFDEKQQKELKKGQFKKIVEKHSIAGIWAIFSYISKVNQLFEEGKLGKEDSIYSYMSPLRVCKRLANTHEENLEYMWSLLPPKERERIQKALKKYKSVLSKLEERASD